MNNWQQHLISHKASIRDAMIRLTELAIINADLFVVDDEGHLLGSVSDGDVRRALINSAEVTHSVTDAMNKNCIAHYGNNPDKAVVQLCQKKRIRFLPLLWPDKTISRIADVDEVIEVVPVEAVLMAGGEGQRLRPLTERLPKPLLPVGGKAIIEHNVDRLIRYGVNQIRISINYLGHLLQAHFADGSSKGIKIQYITEQKPLGTIGAVSAVEDWEKEDILVMNSDLLTDIDFADFYNTFVAQGADLAVAAVPYRVTVPYAVLQTTADHTVNGLAEKPTYTYYSNAGIYLIKRSVLSYIPKDCCYNMPDLIELLIQKGHRVISYPIHSYWLDIGKMDDYLKAQEDVKHLKL